VPGGEKLRSELHYHPFKNDKLTKWENDSKRRTFLDMHIENSKKQGSKKQSYIKQEKWTTSLSNISIQGQTQKGQFSMAADRTTATQEHMNAMKRLKYPGPDKYKIKNRPMTGGMMS
jgi:biopolymer transport protein ExbD